MPVSFAKRYCDIPIGSKNSSFSNSPGVIGSRYSITSWFSLVIVNYLNLLSTSIAPSKANPVAVVHSNAMLPNSIALQRFEPISWRNA